MDDVETLASEPAYEGTWFSVRQDRIRRPDGSTGTYDVVEAKDIAVVVPLDGDRLHLVEQYRHPVRGRRWELPAGTLDDSDDDVAAVAARELREETGLVAGGLALLGTVDVSPGTLDNQCAVFLATDLVPGPPEREPEEGDMVAQWFTRAEVERMIAAGAIRDAKTLAAYTLLLLHERSAPPA